MKRTLAILLVATILCAFFFVALEAEHDCTGEDCLICGILNTCLQLVRCISAVAFLAAVVHAAVLLCRVERIGGFCCTSLIEQKVKLSD